MNYQDILFAQKMSGGGGGGNIVTISKGDVVSTTETGLYITADALDRVDNALGDMDVCIVQYTNGHYYPVMYADGGIYMIVNPVRPLIVSLEEGGGQEGQI